VKPWSESKAYLAGLLGAEQDLLHIPAGLLLYLLLAFLFRRSRRPLLYPLAGLTGLQVLNEVLDAVQWWGWTQTIPWAEAVKDTALTLALPLLVAGGTGFRAARARRAETAR
jgi:hypothetical protein